LIEGEDLEALIKESNELVSIFNAADITSKKNRDVKNAKSNKFKSQDTKRKD
jgi:hypothetical protein